MRFTGVPVSPTPVVAEALIVASSGEGGWGPPLGSSALAVLSRAPDRVWSGEPALPRLPAGAPGCSQMIIPVPVASGNSFRVRRKGNPGEFPGEPCVVRSIQCAKRRVDLAIFL
ncbi:hypothetical protein GCM10017673_52740 [Streptosporangium violaceochromogenes]|nr:hypothetical protein GCM10017673_52740 [Streptosporangium violaceochromogenes]